MEKFLIDKKNLIDPPKWISEIRNCKKTVCLDFHYEIEGRRIKIDNFYNNYLVFEIEDDYTREKIKEGKLKVLILELRKEFEKFRNDVFENINYFKTSICAVSAGRKETIREKVFHIPNRNGIYFKRTDTEYDLPVTFTQNTIAYYILNNKYCIEKELLEEFANLYVDLLNEIRSTYNLNDLIGLGSETYYFNLDSEKHDIEITTDGSELIISNVSNKQLLLRISLNGLAYGNSIEFDTIGFSRYTNFIERRKILLREHIIPKLDMVFRQRRGDFNRNGESKIYMDGTYYDLYNFEYSNTYLNLNGDELFIFEEVSKRNPIKINLPGLYFVSSIDFIIDNCRIKNGEIYFKEKSNMPWLIDTGISSARKAIAQLIKSQIGRDNWNTLKLVSELDDENEYIGDW